MQLAEEITLTDEQENASQKLEQWLDDFREDKALRPFFVLEGYAGTGKSFCINSIIEKLELKAKFMAYTGKAALVLRKYSGVDAATIHSTIYRVRMVSDEVFKELDEKLENTTDEIEIKELEREIQDLKKPTFELDDEAFEDDTPDVLVLDECSMVNDEMLNDLVSFGIPIIALGDPGQLPPVKGEGALFTGIADARLTTIQRQALESPIIKWSMFARERRTIPTTDFDTWQEDEASRLPYAFARKSMWELYQQHDMMIVWKNATRAGINQWVRKKKGFAEQSHDYPVVGETLRISKNDKALGIFNGLSCEVLEVGELFDNYLQVKVKTELGDEKNLNLLRACFDLYNDPDAMEKLRPWDYRNTQQADFGYCITCHKAQGSQWDSVLVLDEKVLNWPKVAEQRARWMYTAVTRAAKKLTIIAK